MRSLSLCRLAPAAVSQRHLRVVPHVGMRLGREVRSRVSHDALLLSFGTLHLARRRPRAAACRHSQLRNSCRHNVGAGESSSLFLRTVDRPYRPLLVRVSRSRTRRWLTNVSDGRVITSGPCGGQHDWSDGPRRSCRSTVVRLTLWNWPIINSHNAQNLEVVCPP